MGTSADQLRETAPPVSVSRAANSTLQSATRPDFGSGLGTATPLEQPTIGKGFGSGVGSGVTVDLGVGSGVAAAVGVGSTFGSGVVVGGGGAFVGEGVSVGTGVGDAVAVTVGVGDGSAQVQAWGSRVAQVVLFRVCKMASQTLSWHLGVQGRFCLCA